LIDKLADDINKLIELRNFEKRKDKRLISII
jgi:hypothetical protein